MVMYINCINTICTSLYSKTRLISLFKSQLKITCETSYIIINNILLFFLSLDRSGFKIDVPSFAETNATC